MAVHYREQQPTFIPPMPLASGPVPNGDGWTLELKWDGCRAQLRYDRRSVTLRTRNGRECSENFPERADIAGVLGRRRVTLDGELVCLRSDGAWTLQPKSPILSSPFKPAQLALHLQDTTHQ